MVRIEKSP